MNNRTNQNDDVKDIDLQDIALNDTKLLEDDNLKTIKLLKSFLINQCPIKGYRPNYIDDMLFASVDELPKDIIGHVMGYTPQRNYRLVSTLWNKTFTEQHQDLLLSNAKYEEKVKNCIIQAVKIGDLKKLSLYLSYGININQFNNLECIDTDGAYLNCIDADRESKVWRECNLLHLVIIQISKNSIYSLGMPSNTVYGVVFRMLIENGIDITHEAKCLLVSTETYQYDYHCSPTEQTRYQELVKSPAGLISLQKTSRSVFDYIRLLLSLREAELSFQNSSGADTWRFIDTLINLGNGRGNSKQAVTTYFSNIMAKKKGLCLDFSDDQIVNLKNWAIKEDLLTIANNKCSMM